MTHIETGAFIQTRLGGFHLLRLDTLSNQLVFVSRLFHRLRLFSGFATSVKQASGTKVLRYHQHVCETAVERKSDTEATSLRNCVACSHRLLSSLRNQHHVASQLWLDVHHVRNQLRLPRMSVFPECLSLSLRCALLHLNSWLSATTRCKDNDTLNSAQGKHLCNTSVRLCREQTRKVTTPPQRWCVRFFLSKRCLSLVRSTSKGEIRERQHHADGILRMPTADETRTVIFLASTSPFHRITMECVCARCPNLHAKVRRFA